MKKLVKTFKYIAILGLGIGLARFVFFRDSIKTIPVRKISSTQRIVTKTVSALGEVKANKEASIAFTTSGTISAIAVSKGDTVSQGKFIASLISPEGDHNIQVAKDSRDIALRERDLFIENYREKSDRDALGGQTQYEIQLRTYEEYASKAEANYQSVLATYSRNYLYAPFDGKVLDVYKTEGEVANPTDPIVKLANEDLVFEVSIDQTDFGLLKEGQSVELTLDAFSNEKFSGRTITLPKYANGSANPNFTVEIAFDDPDKKVLLGMRGDVKITVDSTESEVTSLLYDEVLFDSEDNPFVWIVKNGLLEKMPIEIVLEGDLYTEIKTDISNLILVGPLNSAIQIEQGFRAKIQNE